MRALTRIAGIALIAGLLFVPTMEARTRIYVQIGPPPLVVEHVIPAPGPALVWQNGYYVWTGVQYAWVPGRWVRRPYPYARWSDGRWVRNRRGYYWRAGVWLR